VRCRCAYVRVSEDSLNDQIRHTKAVQVASQSAPPASRATLGCECHACTHGLPPGGLALLKELNIEWIAAHSPQAKGRIERAFQTAQDRLVKGLRQVGANDLDTANAYLQQVYVPFGNRLFQGQPKLAGDAHRACLPGTNLDSVLSIRESRTVTPDYTVRWDGTIYRVGREQIAPGMRAARVQLERRLDGSRWMRWRNRTVPLERCETRPRGIDERTPKVRAIPERSGEEKVRARQRLLDNRRRLSEAYARLPNRPIWQAMKDSPLGAGEFR
jgi:hypothetical protein